MIAHKEPIATPLQCLFLAELATGAKTGKELRVRLSAWGWEHGRLSFYRVIRRMKDAGLITAKRIARDPDEYPGPQCVYELTERGWDDVVLVRESSAEEGTVGPLRKRFAEWTGWTKRPLTFDPQAAEQQLSHESKDLAQRAAVSRSEC